MFKKKLNKKGFTLIELIVVIAVIAILAAVLLPRFTGFSDSAKQAKAKSNIKNYADGVSAMIAEGKTITAADVKNYVGLKEGTLYFQQVGTTADAGDFFFRDSNGILGAYDYETGAITVPYTVAVTLGSGG